MRDMPRGFIIIGAVGVLLVLGALAWVTRQTLVLEKQEAQARAEARYQESVRLVLWRMDSLLTPIIAREASRPYFHYQSFYPADRAYGSMLNRPTPDEPVLPSPLLGQQDPFINLYFQKDDEGNISTPQFPENETLRRTVESALATRYSLQLAGDRKEQFLKLLRSAEVVQPEIAPVPPPASVLSIEPLAAEQPPGRMQQAQTGQTWTQVQSQEELSNSNEYLMRQEVTRQAKSNVTPNRSQQARGPEPAQGAAPPEGADAPSQQAEPPTQLARGAAQTERAPAPADEARKLDLAAPRVGSEAAQTPAAKPAGNAAPDPQREQETMQATDDAGGGAWAEKGGKEQRADAPEPAAQPGSGSVPGADAMSIGLRDQRAVGSDAAPGGVQVLLEPDERTVELGQLEAVWLPRDGAEPELVLQRSVVYGDRTLTQGLWLNWPALKETLLKAAGDRFPKATLRPVVGGFPAGGAAGRSLAAIPAELVVDPPQATLSLGLTPMRSTLLLTWGAAIAALGAIVWVMRTSLDLAEKRGRFVSAVTHELRTPLTTFCLYSQMLADGVVKDEEARGEYHRTLKRESDRLARIVESVLDYAKIGRRAGAHAAKTTAGEVLAAVVPALRTRCEQSGMQLEVRNDANEKRMLMTDTATIERVLYNLVDNACKYAAGAEDRRIVMEARTTPRELVVAIRDFGPGISKDEKAAVFRPFFRGKGHSDGSISGLGLGLALAANLAEQLGGSLKCEGPDDGPGARFVLRTRLDGHARGSVIG